MSTRQIIRIDEDLCTGCGECIPNCAEGALEIVDGVVRVIEERLCDGLGACLGACPEDALSIEEREADAFDEEAVEERLAAQRAAEAARAVFGGGGCPGARSLDLGRGEQASAAGAPADAASGESGAHAASGRQEPPEGREAESLLGHWPVQLGLVNPLAPSFRGADLLIAADCAPVAYRMFHEDFLAGRSVAIACPKLDDAGAHVEKLAELFAAARPRSVTVVHMEVPCCFGLTSLVERAGELAGLEAPIEDVTITVEGTARSAAPARR